MTKPRVPIFTAWPRLPEARFRDLHLACAGHCRGKKTRVRARFDHIAVGLIVGGQGYYSAGGRAAAAITPGALFGVYPGPIFDYGPLAWWEEYYIGFAGRGVRGLIESGLIPRDGRPRQVYDVRLAVRGFEEVIRTWRRRRPGDGDRACLRGLMLLVDLFSDPLVLGASKKVDPIEAVLALCRKRPGEPLDFHQLAADHNISYSTLRQAIRRETGFPPAQYLTRLRCQAACVRLATTMDPVNRIGAEVGIADRYDFSRAFRRVVGVSPQHYRSLQRAYG